MMQKKPWERDWSGQTGQRPSTIIDDPYRADEEQRKRDAAELAAERQRLDEERVRQEQERVRIAREAEARQQRAAEIGTIPEGFRLVDGRLEPIPGSQGRITSEDRGKLEAQLSGATGLVRRIQEIEGRFKRDFTGKSVAEYLPGTIRPQNQEFNDAGRALMGDLAAAFGLTAQQQNTPTELEIRFGPFIPKASDRDEVIASKIARLKEIARAQAAQAGGRLGRDVEPILAPLGSVESAEPQRNGLALTPKNIADQIAGVGKPRVNPDGSVSVRQADGTDTVYPDQAIYAEEMGRARRGEEIPFAGSVTDDSPNDPNGGGGGRDTLGGEIDAIARGISDTATLGLSNPLNAGLNSLLNGTSFADEWAKEQAVIAEDERVNPYARLGGQLVGGIASGYGLARGGAAALPSRPLLGIGAAETGGGALYGGVTSDDPVAGALVGGAMGLAGNQVGQRVLGPLADRVMSRRTAPALRQLSQALPEDDMRVAAALIGEARDLNVPMAIADTGTQARMLAGSATRLAPGGREFAEQVILPRGRAQGERALDAIARDLAQPVNMIDQRNAIQQAARTESQPFYEAAFSRAAPVDDDITAMLGTPAGREALNRAVTIARNEGRDPNALGFDLDELGQVVTVSNPSFETLHMVKRGLDSVVEGNRGATGVLNRSDPSVAAIDGLRARFRTRLGERDPNYAAANQAYAGQMRNRDALDFGYDATRPGTNADSVADALTRMPQEAMQTGYASGLANQVEGARMTSDPFTAIYGTPRQQQKIATVFPEGAEQFGRQAELEGMLARTQYETLGGSPTAGRGAADAQFAPGLGVQMAQDTAIGAVTGIPPIASGMQALRAGLGDRLRFGLGGQQRAEEIARLLLDPDTSMETLQAAIARRAARERAIQAAAGIGGAATIPFAGNQ